MNNGIFSKIKHLWREALVSPILLYKKFISPHLPGACRFEPTCSTYAMEAIRKYGAIKGIALGTWRILRCNPFSKGGYDPLK